MYRGLYQNQGKEMKGEKGFVLIETLVSLALLGVIAVGFLCALSTTFAAATVSQGRTAAESLAKSQLEHIKVQEYVPTDYYIPGDPDKSYELIDIPADLAEKGYSLEINSPVTVISPGVDGQSELQSLTVVVKQNDRTILTISDYKTGKLSE
jgi:prepilin-type N-terminal cleavage/methylation domain-containing protein